MPPDETPLAAVAAEERAEDHVEESAEAVAGAVEDVRDARERGEDDPRWQQIEAGLARIETILSNYGRMMERLDSQETTPTETVAEAVQTAAETPAAVVEEVVELPQLVVATPAAAAEVATGRSRRRRVRTLGRRSD